MEKREIDKLIENYKKSKDYDKANDVLEKIIITFYADKLNRFTKFIFCGKQRMLEEVEKYLEIDDKVNFKMFFEVTNNIALSKEDVFNELETIYYNMYDED